MKDRVRRIVRQIARRVGKSRSALCLTKQCSEKLVCAAIVKIFPDVRFFGIVDKIKNVRALRPEIKGRKIGYLRPHPFRQPRINLFRNQLMCVFRRHFVLTSSPIVYTKPAETCIFISAFL